MKIESQQDLLDAITATYSNRGTCVKLAERLRVHYNGEMPKAIISERRPKEPEEVKKYREKIYKSKTKNPICKVISSLEKIRRAQDWSIDYKADASPKSIADGETLQDYCEFNYPVMTSITNWVFSELLSQSLIDANGIVAVVMEKLPRSRSEYRKPVAKFFSSSQIVDFVEGEYAILLSNDKTTYYTNNGNGKRVSKNGRIYYVLTENEFIRFEENGQDEFDKTLVVHNIGKLPAWKVGGVFYSRVNNDTIYDSFLSGMVDDLDEAARLYSDLQAELVQHVFSEKYVYSNTECPDCKGSGYLRDKDGKFTLDEDGNKIKCKKCGGSGIISTSSPYGTYVVHAQNVGEGNIPTPPVGYVQKSTEIANLLDKLVRDKCRDALAAVNMEFLAETPIDQSGVAKAYDANELNNFVNRVAENIVRNMDNIYYFINEYRYRETIADKKKREAMLPGVNVPTKFDIANTTILMQELQGARQAKVNPVIIKQLEIAYAKAQFNTDPRTALMTEVTFNLDPLFGVEEENKMTMLQNGGVSKTSYIISSNIQAFVYKAFTEDAEFEKKTYEEQMKKMEEYAGEVEKATKSVKPSGNDDDNDFGGLGKTGNKKEEDEE